MRLAAALVLAAVLALPAAAKDQAGVALTATPSPVRMDQASTFSAVVGVKFDTSDGGRGKVAAGSGHTCAVTAAGGAMCWGWNFTHQLGDGTGVDRLLPVAVKGVGGNGVLTGVRGLATGQWHSCALLSAGTVACWGNNIDHQLGFDVPGGVQPTPNLVPGVAGVTAIAAGDKHTCALLISGKVSCWGLNDVGQIGTGASGGDVPSPVEVAGLSGVTAIAAGGLHTCALLTDRTVRCWGANGEGQAGTGVIGGFILSPVPVVGLAGTGVLSGVTEIAAGNYNTCAALLSGGARCWGDNSYGQLGDGTTDGHASPVVVKGEGGEALAGIKMLAVGELSSCALTTAGAVLCVGSNYYGQLGDGTRQDRHLAAPIVGQPAPYQSIALGHSDTEGGAVHGCGLSAGGTLHCWGDNIFGQIGNGIARLRASPAAVSDLSGATALEATDSNSCVLVAGGAVRCFGANDTGQLGNGDAGRDSAVPVAVKTAAGAAVPLSGATQIAVGKSHNCALLPSAGEVRCWGANGDGQLGDGGTQDRAVASLPVAFPAGQPASRIAAGSSHSCAVVAGKALCWGWNNFGQLGTNDKVSTGIPAEVQGFAADEVVTDIAAGLRHSCALYSSPTKTGSVKCWGDGEFGQLGNGDSGPGKESLVATQVGVISGVGLLQAAAITAGSNHTCVLAPGSGGAYCWGASGSGQTGGGILGDQVQPSLVKDADGKAIAGFTDIDAGFEHTCAVLNGTVACWGANFRSQLGNGGFALSPTPVPVLSADGNPLAATAVAAGGEHSCAILSGGAVSCWGLRYNGQIGDGKFGYASMPDTVGPDATGTVSFVAKGKTIGTAALVDGVASFKKRLPANLHRITAVFKGDGTYLAATSPVLKHLVTGTPGKDRLRGGKAGDTLHGSSGNDRILGRGGADSLNGGAGRDRIEGGPGRDRLAGGPGKDVFVFRNAADSRPGRPDTITDFARGDRIDVSAFAGDGSVRFRRAKSRLEVDVDRDGRADFAVVLKGVKRLPRAAVRK